MFAYVNKVNPNMPVTEFTEIVGVRMTPDMFRWLRNKAETERRTVSQMARVLLEKVQKSDGNHTSKKEK